MRRHGLQVASAFAVPAVGSTACNRRAAARCRASAVSMDGKKGRPVASQQPRPKTRAMHSRSAMIYCATLGWRKFVCAHLASIGHSFLRGRLNAKEWCVTDYADLSLLRFPCNAYEQFLVVHGGALAHLESTDDDVTCSYADQGQMSQGHSKTLMIGVGPETGRTPAKGRVGCSPASWSGARRPTSSFHLGVARGGVPGQTRFASFAAAKVGLRGVAQAMAREFWVVWGPRSPAKPLSSTPGTNRTRRAQQYRCHRRSLLADPSPIPVGPDP